MRPRTDASSYRYLQSLHEHAGDHYVLYPMFAVGWPRYRAPTRIGRTNKSTHKQKHE
jgi:hypothetical protein